MRRRRTVIVGDFGKDMDDEFCLPLAEELERQRVIRLMAVIANLAPAVGRARLAKGTLKALGMGRVPVGIGEEVTTAGRVCSHETVVPYLADASELDGSGFDLLVRTLTAADDHSVTLVLNSAFTDAAALMRECPSLVRNKVRSVAVMGGVQPNNGWLVPEDAANNNFDPAAAEYLYAWLQENRVESTVLMREAAYACQMAAWLPVRLAEIGHPVGIELARRLPLAMDDLWEAVHAPAGSPVRGSLPPSRTRDWYVRTTTGNKDPGVPGDETVWPFVETFRLYDPLNLLASVPSLRDRYFDAEEFEILGTTHRVIGRTRERHGIRDPARLQNDLARMISSGLQP